MTLTVGPHFTSHVRDCGPADSDHAAAAQFWWWRYFLILNGLIGLGLLKWLHL